MLHWDDAVYTQLLKAKNADVYLYTRETTQDYPDFYSADADLSDGKKMTDANPQQKNFLWTKGSKLIEYTGVRGEKLQGASIFRQITNPGRSTRRSCTSTKSFRRRANAYPQPGFNGFSVGAYTSNGYAVLTPDIDVQGERPRCLCRALHPGGAEGGRSNGHCGSDARRRCMATRGADIRRLSR